MRGGHCGAASLCPEVAQRWCVRAGHAVAHGLLSEGPSSAHQKNGKCLASSQRGTLPTGPAPSVNGTSRLRERARMVGPVRGTCVGHEARPGKWNAEITPQACHPTERGVRSAPSRHVWWAGASSQGVGRVNVPPVKLRGRRQRCR